MKKSLLSLLVLVVTAAAVFAQTANTQDPINQIVDGKRQGYWKLSALFLKMPSPWLPAQIVEEGNYDKSLKTGIWNRWFQNGNKESEITYVNNRPNGPAKTYFENGKLEAEGNWVGTRWTGAYTLYYENGNVRQKFNYNAMGVRDGPQTYYHPNGKVAIEINMKAGKEDGVGKEYNTNGELIKETYSTNGVMDASKTVVHEPKKPVDPNAGKTPEELEQEKEKGPKVGTGEVAQEGPFDGNGYHTLRSNGNITFKGTFKNYQLIDGEQRFYNSAGFCTRVKLFENGKYKGEGVIPEESKQK